jgi:hypothetical protein
MFVALGVLEDSLAEVMQHIQSQQSADQWDQRVLLELVLHDGGLRFTVLTDSQPLLCVFDGDVNLRFGGSEAHGGNTQPSTKQPLRNFEEPLLNSLDFTRKLPLLIHIGVPVEHIDPGNPHIMELESRIIDSIEPQLPPHITNLHSWQLRQLLISHRNDESIHTLVFAFDDGLAEHQCIVGMDSAVGDPVLLREGCRGIDDELFGFVVVGDCGLHLDGVVTVAQLRQAETPSDIELVDQREQEFMAVGMQGCDCAAE